MKREGRQHGMIRTHMILPNNKHYTQFQTPHHSNEGILARVAAKPTNHSKSTRKVGKSRYGGGGGGGGKDKAKGHQKVKAFDVGMNHRLVSWRVVDDKGYHGLNYVGVSASDVLGHLSNYYHDYENEDDEEDHDQDEQSDCYHDTDDSFGLSDELVIGSCSVTLVEDKEEEEIVHGGKEIDIDEVVDDDDDMGMYDFVDDDGDMGFCDVGFVIQQLDGDSDEGWCLVGELGGD